MSIKAIIDERESTHGDFTNVAAAAQSFKNIIRYSANCNTMPDDVKEALEMITHKISRIISGDYMEKDHWLDIQGYAELILKRIEKVERLKQLEGK